MSQVNFFSEFKQRMQSAKIGEAGIKAFQNSYNKLLEGQTGLLSEGEIEPVSHVPLYEEVTESKDHSLLGKALILKLNGGLGTSMGLAGPKSLLKIKGDNTFLDFIIKQILHIRQAHQSPLRFLLMNSRSTSLDTLTFLKKFPELGDSNDLELMQGYVPKVDAQTLRPVSFPESPELEWCPPGHGDLYASMLGSGWLDRLLSDGIRYLFVSNSDNLGASLDVGLLTYFASSNLSFLMEVAERTSSDRKGGHLARSLDGKLLLRESAQCPEPDIGSFQDVNRHRFFNTNNLWIRLDHLKTILAANGGVISLPLIKNLKTVDPQNKTSTSVIQLETAMGAAIECFDQAGAVRVPRTRFAPVKSTSDLLAIRSDAYEITKDWRLILGSQFNGQPPKVDLDSQYYKIVDQLDSHIQRIPSLRDCKELRIRGPVTINEDVVFKGIVQVENLTSSDQKLAGGEYENEEIQLNSESAEQTG